mmetsp:Transcript_15681/g.24405  ORF Transcript_15681/g.24405 Transcript_15681/m.24405 type:complete len:203 (+) Transcript_15681:180-788(+)|eukprot:CAMPEP_0196806190 /NCGR_PEP_ID=MMETSP1362-20130617/6061_1 /TAXON_ID=163516 /ORGANISM="Leptocylindrus danicus, Strain CCMP1856" /LENGTH=202 /DNA_ID=CAMNT_0042179549 /DNA_START=151 /DNA_END=759 /DNA_ORIENTATION=-
MKYIEDTKLQRFTQNLTDQVVGFNRIMNGRIEAFSCKRGQSDKKTSQKLKEMHEGKQLYSTRLLTDLVLTLNASFQDYDFSLVKPSQFHRVDNPQVAMNIINNHLAEYASSNKTTFLPSLWDAVDEVISLSECDVIQFDGDNAGGTNMLWEFHYFFYNKFLKRILLFSCSQEHSASYQYRLRDMSDGEESEEMGDYLYDYYE